jgi:hypothetical protein
MGTYITNLSPCTTCQECKEPACGPAKPVVTSSGTASGTNGNYFSYQITASNSPTSWGVTGLPAGLSINYSTGLISGTVYCPGFTMNVSAANACGTGYKDVVVTVTGAGSVITSASTTTGKQNTAFSFTITGTNSPTTFTATSLPSGLFINGSTGQITGTPTVHGVFSVPISVSNGCGGSSGTLTITIDGDCAIATLQCDSISASLSKCGFYEYYPYGSTPPKVYRTRAWSGGMAQQTFDDASCDPANLLETYEIRFSGSVTYARSTCSVSGTNNWAEYRDGTLEDNGTTTSTSMSSFVLFCSGECDPTTTSTSQEFVPDNTCVGSYPSHKTYAPSTPGGNAKETLSDEYTTANLISDTEAALPSYPGTWAGTCSSYRDISNDEITYTIRRFKYRFKLPTLTGYTVYNFSWSEGGVSRSYTWNGTDTYTPTYTVNEPSVDGTISITDVVISRCY